MLLRRKSLVLALTAGAISCLFLPDRIGLPGCVSAQNSDSPKIVPLDVKPGLWEIIVHTSITDINYADSEAALQETLKSYPPEQRAKVMANVKVQEQKTIEKQKAGSEKKSRMCPLNQDFLQAIGPGSGGTCSKQISSTGQELNLHIVCKAADGKPGEEQTTKFRRIDAENFQGTMQLNTHVGATGTVTRTYSGKWISDSCSGPPAGYAAKNGLHPKGPADVARDDPNRIVAVINGKDVTAQQAWNMIKKVPPQTRNGYKTGMSGLLERLYLQDVIAQEALKLHLDQQQPWKDQLKKTKQNDLQHVQNYAGDPNIPPEVWARWVDDQHHILWKAYFSQAATKEENAALEVKEKAKYKITVKDSDFFAATP